jgi:hypothetical protein
MVIHYLTTPKNRRLLQSEENSDKGRIALYTYRPKLVMTEIGNITGTGAGIRTTARRVLELRTRGGHKRLPFVRVWEKIKLNKIILEVKPECMLVYILDPDQEYPLHPKLATILHPIADL